jgi:hypothetical protein
MAQLNIEQLETALKKYVPAKSLHYCVNWIVQNNISLRISKSRHSKYGDYRPPFKGAGHRISINGDLNPYAFLITFVHEVAHLNQWKHYKAIYEPHGKLWKNEYKKLMMPLLNEHIFPATVVTALKNYMQNPAATSCTDHDLLKALREFDAEKDEWLTLEEIEMNVTFRIRTGRRFIKKQKLRKNYSCVDVRTKNIYMINPLTEVQVV